MRIPKTLLTPWLVDIGALALIHAVVLLPPWWGLGADVVAPTRAERNTVAAMTAAFLICAWLLRDRALLPGLHTLGRAANTLTGVFGVLLLLIVLLRLDYSRSLLLLYFVTCLIWFQLQLYHRVYFSRIELLQAPGGRQFPLEELRGRLRCRQLKKPELPDARFTGVVADLHSQLPEEWSRMLAEASLRGVPIYDSGLVYETLSGRVPLNYLSDHWLGILQPPFFYVRVKRLIDISAAAAALIALAPLLALIALAIRRDSPGPALFSQRRIGYKGGRFRIWKFRTLRDRDHGDTAAVNPKEVTRVGRWLRRFRLDELPQFWNVLRGDMSIIGPRALTDAAGNEALIPFFRHRHVVRPGISGWAQVNQEYAPDEDIAGTREKLERDFYYIHHQSLYLDVLIAILTVRVILTGRGTHLGAADSIEAAADPVAGDDLKPNAD